MSPLPLSLMFSLAHNSSLWSGAKTITNLFSLQSGLPAGDTLPFGISGRAVWVEVFGTVLDMLCISRKHYQG